MGDGPSNELAWSAPPAPEMFRTIAPQSVGYLVERASSASGPWQTLNGVPVTAEGFQDATPPAVGETFYRVLAASADGTVSEPAGPVSITRALAPVTDTAAAPATPVDTRTPLLTLDDQSVAVPAAASAVDAVPGGESVLFGGSQLYDFGGGSAGLIFGTNTAPVATGDGAATASPSPSATDAASDGLVIGSAEDDAAADPTDQRSDDTGETTDAASTSASSPLADGSIAVIAIVTLLALLGLALVSRRRHRGGSTTPPPPTE